MIEDADGRVTSLTINNVHVYRVGEVLTLLQDAGFDVEINLGKRLPTERSDQWLEGYESGYGAGTMDHATQANTAHGQSRLGDSHFMSGDDL